MGKIKGTEVFAGAFLGVLGLAVLRFISWGLIISDDPELMQELRRLNDLENSAGNVVFDSEDPSVGEHYEKTKAQWRTELSAFDEKVMARSYLGQSNGLQWAVAAASGAALGAGRGLIRK